ncbi:MAG: sel1 repeat family protein [Deltaproteobacteria bacterium]|nr:sel1 repeat family protein [Deltaproteobacteria bacterium]
MRTHRLLFFSFLFCFVFPILSYADQIEDARAALQNEEFTKAYELLSTLAEADDAEAQFLLGSLYINGQGVEKDDTKGLSWIMKSARQGYDQARLRAFSIYFELAGRGDASAMYNLGYMCLHGWGGEQDPDIGIGWLESAAKNGHDHSAKVLSGIYAEGKFGISPDEDKASYWSNLPAEFAAGIDGTYSREALTQGDPATEPTFDSDAREYILEDIIIEGKRVLHSLKMEMIRIEDLKFEIFNSLNSTNDFDITCEIRELTGSIIPRRVCEAGYMKKARVEDMQIFLDGFMDAYVQDPGFPTRFQPLFPRSDDLLIGEFAQKAEALKKEMIELGSKHPLLGKVMMYEYELKQRYIVEHREKFKDSMMIGHPEPEEYFGDELKFLNIFYLAYYSGMIEEEIWHYWDERFRSVIHQEPYRSIWLSSNTETYADLFVSYVNRILSGV